MTVHRGDVVRVDWPYSDRTGSKVRPALVIRADTWNGLLADTVLLLISRTHRALSTTEAAIDPAVETGCGLRYPSVVSCNNLLTIDQSLIVGSLGRLSPAAMQQVDDRVKTALGLA
jgi:mRNA interferase MazF